VVGRGVKLGDATLEVERAHAQQRRPAPAPAPPAAAAAAAAAAASARAVGVEVGVRTEERAGVQPPERLEPPELLDLSTRQLLIVTKTPNPHEHVISTAARACTAT